MPVVEAWPFSCFLFVQIPLWTTPASLTVDYVGVCLKKKTDNIKKVKKITYMKISVGIHKTNQTNSFYKASIHFTRLTEYIKSVNSCSITLSKKFVSNCLVETGREHILYMYF